MPTESFFTESSEQSMVKTAIVSKYFWAWAKVIIPSVKKFGSGKIAYIDLFCGPGPVPPRRDSFLLQAVGGRAQEQGWQGP